ncbi:MAG: S-layer homology domain-containing protein, partial [Clostridia bacterium]|nr:S-layer homology domain-containing protein [Clostridia bacterium]
DTIADDGSSKGHTPGEWVITKEATEEAEGERVKKCTVCGTVLETGVIKKLSKPVIEFRDVSPTAWYSEGVNYCSAKGYITGIGNNQFNPDGKLTREQFVVILARIAGADLTSIQLPNLPMLKFLPGTVLLLYGQMKADM